MKGETFSTVLKPIILTGMQFPVCKKHSIPFGCDRIITIFPRSYAVFLILFLIHYVFWMPLYFDSPFILIFIHFCALLHCPRLSDLVCCFSVLHGKFIVLSQTVRPCLYLTVLYDSRFLSLKLYHQS